VASLCFIDCTSSFYIIFFIIISSLLSKNTGFLDENKAEAKSSTLNDIEKRQMLRKNIFGIFYLTGKY